MTLNNKENLLYVGYFKNFEIKNILKNIDYDKNGFFILSFIYGRPDIIIATLKTPLTANTYDYNVISYNNGKIWYSINIHVEYDYSECKNV